MLVASLIPSLITDQGLCFHAMKGLSYQAPGSTANSYTMYGLSAWTTDRHRYI